MAMIIPRAWMRTFGPGLLILVLLVTASPAWAAGNDKSGKSKKAETAEPDKSKSGKPAPQATTDEDDDCDGNTDEGLGLGACTVGVGACERTGTNVCNASGTATVCGATPGDAVAELCNGIDDDCDGETDEGQSGSPCTVGVGACERSGSTSCIGGRFSCDAIAGESVAEICNGIDDDCDGNTDEGLELGACTVGIGACERAGTNVCNATGTAIVCGATPGDVVAELCNEIDDDCDGDIDEDFDLGGVCTVGLGICERTGNIICSGEAAGCDVVAGTAVAESCNGQDDNCDGDIDEGFICPDVTVANTVALTEGVYFLTNNGSAGRERVNQCWPVFDETKVVTNFRYYATWWNFRPSDGELFYRSSVYGLFQHHEDIDEELLSTPPCVPRGLFGFDTADNLYYRCADSSLRRDVGVGTVVMTDVESLLAVTADGRSLVSQSGQLTMLSAGGAVLNTFDPPSEFAGSLTLYDARITVNGDDIFLPYRRQFLGQQWEAVVFRINVSNELLLVRRLPFGVVEPNYAFLPTSDGAIFEAMRDPDPESSHIIIRHDPDGSEATVWKQSDGSTTVSGVAQLLVGPRQEADGG